MWGSGNSVLMAFRRGMLRLVRRVVPDATLRKLRAIAESVGRRPVISVIMPVYDVERYVGACLDSVLSQDFGSFEVLAVDDASNDRSASIVKRYAARDRRVRLLRQAHAGQGPARNLGIHQARGKFLVFVDSDDIVPPGSFRFLVTALRRSGSDFAVAGVRRLQGDRTFRPSWSVVVHEHDRIGINIDDFPAAMADVVAHHRIFRTQFWKERIGEFPSGIYEDHVPMVTAYLRARRFDLLARVTYEWRLRDEGTSTGQQKHDLANLTTRVLVKAQAYQLVRRDASPAVRAAWLGRVLNIDFPPYVELALVADDAYRHTLQEALEVYISLATPGALAHVRVRQKVRTYLAARGMWGALQSAERAFDAQGSIPPTVIREGRVFLETSPVPATEAVLPDEMTELAQSECRLQVCLAECEIVDQAALRLTGWAVIRAVDLSSRVPQIAIALVGGEGGVRIELAVEPLKLPEATEWVRWPHGSFDRAGFRVTIGLDALAVADRREAAWHLAARVEVDGVVREGGAYHAVAGSSASRAVIATTRVKHGATVVQPTFDHERGFTIRTRRGGPLGDATH